MADRSGRCASSTINVVSIATSSAFSAAERTDRRNRGVRTNLV
jgi:hypothetical protein